VDAIQVVKRDHRVVEQLFKQFERAETAGRPAELKRVVQKLVRELSIHAAVEEQILYPALRRIDAAIEDEVLEALEEHHLVKLTLLELDEMSPEDERYRAKVSVLIESVRHHVEEEEKDLLPRLAKAFAPRDRRELGTLLEEAKKGAPTHPHPGAPDTPPGNLLAGALSALLDRARDALREAANRGRRMAQGRARKMRGQARKAMANGRSMVQKGRSMVREMTGGESEQPHA
jgi:hemerythrin superfamily protein